MEKRSAGGPRKDVGRRKTLKLFGRRNSRKGAGKEEKIRRTSAEARRWAEISERRQQNFLKMSKCSLEDVGRWKTKKFVRMQMQQHILY